jgi:hypothetical protein
MDKHLTESVISFTASFLLENLVDVLDNIILGSRSIDLNLLVLMNCLNMVLGHFSSFPEGLDTEHDWNHCHSDKNENDRQGLLEVSIDV